MKVKTLITNRLLSKHPGLVAIMKDSSMITCLELMKEIIDRPGGSESKIDHFVRVRINLLGTK
jgi:hypothetical protein